MNLSTCNSLSAIWKRKHGGPREFSPGEFDAFWTLYNRGLDTLYQSSAVQLESGGAYTIESGLEIQINGTWTDQPGTLLAGDVIRVRATSLNEYFVEGVSGTLALKLTIDGTDCTFTLINMVEPPASNWTDLQYFSDGEYFED